MIELISFPLFYLFCLLLVLTLYLAVYVHRMDGRFGRISPRRGLRGLELARWLLDKRQLYEIPVERLANGVVDGYDQGTRVLRLPVSICEGSSFRHLGQAVHEASRAFQDMEGSILPWMRDRIGRAARFLLRFVPLLFLVGIFFSTWLIKMVMVLFVGAVLFTVLILCMETKAVQSTLALLREARVFDPDELVVMKRALGVSLLRELASYPLVLMKPFSLR